MEQAQNFDSKLFIPICYCCIGIIILWIWFYSCSCVLALLFAQPASGKYAIGGPRSQFEQEKGAPASCQRQTLYTSICSTFQSLLFGQQCQPFWQIHFRNSLFGTDSHRVASSWNALSTSSWKWFTGKLDGLFGSLTSFERSQQPSQSLSRYQHRWTGRTNSLYRHFQEFDGFEESVFDTWNAFGGWCSQHGDALASVPGLSDGFAARTSSYSSSRPRSRSCSSKFSSNQCLEFKTTGTARSEARAQSTKSSMMCDQYFPSSASSSSRMVRINSNSCFFSSFIYICYG